VLVDVGEVGFCTLLISVLRERIFMARMDNFGPILDPYLFYHSSADLLGASPEDKSLCTQRAYDNFRCRVFVN
jgi:hypothetical protein